MPCRSPKDLEVHWFSLIAQNKFAELGEELKVLRQRVGLTQLEVCQAALGQCCRNAAGIVTSTPHVPRQRLAFRKFYAEQEQEGTTS